MLFLLAACNIKNNDIAVDNRLSELIREKDYFKFRTELVLAKKSLSEDRYLFYKALCDDAFNDIASSQKCVEVLFDKYSEVLSDSTKKDLLAIKIRNHIRQYEYTNIVNTCQQLLNEYSHELDSSERVKYIDTHSMYQDLINIKPTVVHKNRSFEIPSHRNPYLNLIMMPVTKGSTSATFMFDTGADYSAITKRCAENMGLTIYETNTDVQTSVGIIKASIAVADSLYVGDILFENVILLVVPLFSIPEFDFKMNGIIGVNEMRRLEEIQVNKDGSIFVPENPSNKEMCNMYFGGLEGLSTSVQIHSDNETLLMEFDTGANMSNLTKKYYNKYQNVIEEKGSLNNYSIYGASTESNQVESFTLTDFPYMIGTKSYVLPEIDVNLSYGTYEEYDGLIGQDMLLPFDRMVINFKNMYVDFE